MCWIHKYNVLSTTDDLFLYVQIGPMNGVLLDLQKCPSSYLIWPRHFFASLSREEGSKSSLRSLSAVKVKFDWSTCGKSSLLLIWYVIALAVSAQFHEKEIPENKENRLPKTLVNISRAYNILYLFLTSRSRTWKFLLVRDVEHAQWPQAFSGKWSLIDSIAPRSIQTAIGLSRIMDCQPGKQQSNSFRYQVSGLKTFLYDEESIAWFECDKMNRKIFEE